MKREPIPIEYDIDCAQDKIANLRADIQTEIHNLWHLQRELEETEERLDDYIAIKDAQ